MRASQFLSTFLLLSSCTAAFEWQDSLGNLKNLEALPGNNIFRRQDSPKSSDAPKPSQTPDSTQAEKTGGGDGDSKPTNTGGSSPTGTQNAKDTKVTGKPRSTAFDPRLPAGGISMATPGPFDQPRLFKIGDWITFGWNYTSLSVPPNAIDILATCTKNQAVYTLALNQSYEATGKFLWDTGEFQATATVPLLTEQYTLIIYDAQSSVTAQPRSGYLAPAQFPFALYKGQEYKNRDEWTCVGCNAAGRLSAAERQTLLLLVSMCTMTVLSFTWFSSGFGVF